MLDKLLGSIGARAHPKQLAYGHGHEITLKGASLGHWDTCWIGKVSMATDSEHIGLQAQAGIVLGVWRDFLDAAESQQLSQHPAAIHRRFAESVWDYVVQAIHNEEAWFLVSLTPSVMHAKPLIVSGSQLRARPDCCPAETQRISDFSFH